MENEFIVKDDLLATKGQRFLNYIIDIIVIYVSIIIVFIILSVIASIVENNSFLIWMQNISDLEGYLVFFAVMIPYYTFMESIFSSTIGKFVTQTKVVLINGSKPDSQTILKRTFCRIIPFDGFSFLGTSANGWHDSMTGTYVVNKKMLQTKLELHNSFENIGKETIQ